MSDLVLTSVVQVVEPGPPRHGLIDSRSSRPVDLQRRKHYDLRSPTGRVSRSTQAWAHTDEPKQQISRPVSTVDEYEASGPLVGSTMCDLKSGAS
jgi:hypothetical protein